MTWKYLYALDIAVAEQFEWEYESADEDALYECVELLGYWWDDAETRWHGPEEPPEEATP